MCRNLAAKSGQEVRAFDSDLEALAQMDEARVSPAESIKDVAEHADIVFLSLPGGPHVSAVCLGAGSLLTLARVHAGRLTGVRRLGGGRHRLGDRRARAEEAQELDMPKGSRPMGTEVSPTASGFTSRTDAAARCGPST